MTTPRVRFLKQDGQTGVVRPGIEGILAIIAAALTGNANQPAPHNDKQAAQDEFSWGPLVEAGTYAMAETQLPVLLVKPVTTTLGAYSSVVKAGGGTATPAATASTHPYDDFNVIITFDFGGVLGVAGILYRYSLDGGKTYSAQLALGTALIIVIPNTGISITLGTATQTILLGETVTFTTTRPMMTNADLPASLEALRLTAAPFESVLIDMIADDTTVGLVAAWLLELNKLGRFPQAFMTSRPMNAGETEAQYLTAMTAVLAAAGACDDIVFCFDEGSVPSSFRGIRQDRPTGFHVAARSMAVPVGTEPAFVELGPLTGVEIVDARGNPLHHNEEKSPGLDDIRGTTLRTIAGEEGVYITNTRLISASGSDYVYLPHARTMNAAASIAYQILIKKLSGGFAKNPKVGPNDARYIADHVAQLWEGLVNSALRSRLKGQVDDIQLTISRTDDVSSNQGASIKCRLESVSLGYVKEFVVTQSFVKALTAAQ